MKYKKLLNDTDYYTLKDLKYNSKFNIKLNNDELIKFKEYKENNSDYKLTLKSFNSKFIFFNNHQSLNDELREFTNYNTKYFQTNNISLMDKKFSNIMISRILSEIEGTLSIENIPTTRKNIQNVLSSKKIKSPNDIIIKNMDNGIRFILEQPKFNKENLFKLYTIISDQSLSEDLVLKNNEYYRYDKVYIDTYDGCDVTLISQCMDSLFDFINDNLNEKTNMKYYLPHIAHYYILYIHPYFDFNGRCARLVSLWISVLGNIYEHPLYISEAINDNKKDYYTAITNTRDMNNDLTYFFKYIFEISNKFYLLYENIESIEKHLLNNAIILTLTESYYLKRILSKLNTTYFNQKMFIEFVNLEMTKQGALKILNKFEEYNVLKSIKNNKNQKMFYVNVEYLT